MGFFDINYDSLNFQLLPVRLRKQRMLAWVRCLTVPIRWLHNLFMSNRAINQYFLAHNGQVCHLEKVLNDAFDSVSREIVITDGIYEDPVFTFLAVELKPVWLGLGSEMGATVYESPMVLYTGAETSLLGNSFIVKVPSSVLFDEDRMRALIDRYRLAGRSVYEIVLH